MEKTFFSRTGELVWEEIFDFFVIIFTLFSVCPFLKFGVPKCFFFQKKNIHTFFLGVIIFTVQITFSVCPKLFLKFGYQNVGNFM